MPIDTDNTWLTWCEPMERAKMKVLDSDIPLAIQWYGEQTGELPNAMALHPKNEALAEKVPKGIEVCFIGGCLQWQIWLAAAVPTYRKIAVQKAEPMIEHPAGIMSTIKDEKNKVDIIQSVTQKVTHGEKRGPKPRELPVETILQWAGEGMGSKVIADRLAKEYGITTSYRTILRILSGQRELI